MWAVFKMRELMNGSFRAYHKFICLLTLSFIFISCGSLFYSSQQPVAPQQPVERQLKRYTTYQTSLTNEDIMKSFVNEVRTYLQRYDRYDCYYLVIFRVSQESKNQNYAWTTDTVEKRYQWGTVYEITLYIANAWLEVSFCNTSYTDGGQSTRKIVTTRSGTVGGNAIRKDIVDTAISMFEESEMVLKMNTGRNYSDESKAVFLAEIMRIMQ